MAARASRLFGSPRRFVPAVKVADEKRDMLDDKPVTQEEIRPLLWAFLGDWGRGESPSPTQRWWESHRGPDPAQICSSIGDRAIQLDCGSTILKILLKYLAMHQLKPQR